MKADYQLILAIVEARKEGLLSASTAQTAIRSVLRKAALI